MFKGAHEIQEWLKECAKRITKSLSPEDIEGKAPSTSTPRLHTVIWTSPLGLPVCQPYRKVEAGSIQTLMTNIFILNPNKIGPVNVRKQMSAFPPNFIHSLDASHMLMSAIACNKVGLTFAAVHDSFWTHASDVDMMNVVLREAFIKLHSSDLVERLRNDFMERYKGHIYPEETENKKVRWKPLEFPPVPKKVSHCNFSLANCRVDLMLRGCRTVSISSLSLISCMVSSGYCESSIYPLGGLEKAFWRLNCTLWIDIRRSPS